MKPRTIGKIHALSVANTSHTSVQVSAYNGNVGNAAMFLNTGTTVVTVTLSKESTAPATVLPVDGTPATATLVLPASMIAPILWATPQTPFTVTAIGSAAGPGIVYVTPVEV